MVDVTEDGDAGLQVGSFADCRGSGEILWAWGL